MQQWREWLVIIVQYTVPFQSIRQGLWYVMGLPKFWFQRPPKVAVTCPKFWAFFSSLAPQVTKKISTSVTWLPNEFGTPWKLPWQSWHFSILKCPVTRDCRIEWNGTVCTTLSKCGGVQWTLVNSSGLQWTLVIHLLVHCHSCGCSTRVHRSPLESTGVHRSPVI